MKKNVFLVIWLSGWLIACSGQPSAVSNQATVDPFVAVESAQRTAEAAQDEADFYSRQLTATAEAPIVAITQTAAEFAMQQQYAQATSQASMMTQTAAMTQTAQSWTPTVVPTSTPNLTATIEAAQLNATVTAINLNTEKKKISNNFFAVIVPIGILVGILIVSFALIQTARYFRKRPIERDARGDAKLIEDRVSGEIIDPDANPNYSTGKYKSLAQQMLEQYLENRYGLIPQLPHITAERQDKVKENDQKLDLITRGLPGGTKRTAGQKQLNPNNLSLLGGGQKLENRFQILDSNQYPPAHLIDGQIVDVLEADWEAAMK